MNNMNPLVSVILYVYNGEKYIAAAIESVIGQTYKNIQFIIVDSFSSDKTVEIIEKYKNKDSRIEFYQIEKKSMGAQCNYGISKAKGVFLSFIESDDEYSPNFLENLLDIAKSHPECDVIKSDYLIFTEHNGKRFFIENRIFGNSKENLYFSSTNLKKNNLILDNDFTMWNGIYRADFIRKVHISLNETPGASFQDYTFVKMVHFFAAHEFFIHEARYLYRKDNAGSSCYSCKAIINVLQEINLFLENFFIKDRNLYKIYAAKLVNIELLRITNYFIERYIREKKLFVSQEEKNIFEAEYTKLLKKIKLLGSLKFFNITNLIKICISNLDLYLNNLEVIGNYYSEEIKSFYDKISHYENIFVFGYGASGKGVFSFLKNKDFESNKINLMYCDNSCIEIKKDKISNALIYPVDSAIKFYNTNEPSSTCFIISYPEFSDSMVTQLINKSIDIENIIVTAQAFIHSVNNYSPFEI